MALDQVVRHLLVGAQGLRGVLVDQVLFALEGRTKSTSSDPDARPNVPDRLDELGQVVSRHLANVGSLDLRLGRRLGLSGCPGSAGTQLPRRELAIEVRGHSRGGQTRVLLPVRESLRHRGRRSAHGALLPGRPETRKTRVVRAPGTVLLLRGPVSRRLNTRKGGCGPGGLLARSRATTEVLLVIGAHPNTPAPRSPLTR